MEAEAILLPWLNTARSRVLRISRFGPLFIPAMPPIAPHTLTYPAPYPCSSRTPAAAAHQFGKPASALRTAAKSIIGATSRPTTVSVAAVAQMEVRAG